MAIDILSEFADAEEVLRTYLSARLGPGVAVVSATGPTLVAPTVKAQRIGGTCDRITDFPEMLVSSFGATRSESIVLAAQVQAHILNATNTPVALSDGRTALIDGAVISEADHPELYANPDVRHVIATFELRLRRPKPAP